MAYVRDNITHSTGIDDKVVFSQSLHTWNPKYAPMVGVAGKVTMNALTFIIAMIDTQQSNIARFSEKIDLTGISKIKLKAGDTSGSASMFVSENGSNIIKSVAIDQVPLTEYILDVGELTGEYYICFSASVMSIHEVTLE